MLTLSFMDTLELTLTLPFMDTLGLMLTLSSRGHLSVRAEIIIAWTPQTYVIAHLPKSTFWRILLLFRCSLFWNIIKLFTNFHMVKLTGVTRNTIKLYTVYTEFSIRYLNTMRYWIESPCLNIYRDVHNRCTPAYQFCHRLISCVVCTSEGIVTWLLPSIIKVTSVK